MHQKSAQFNCINCDKKFSTLHNLKEHAKDCVKLSSCCEGKQDEELRHHTRHKKDFNYYLTIGLVVLFLIFLLQSVQLLLLQKQISGATVNTQAPAQVLPSSLQNLPDMVGGC